jgi:flavin-binding protein dodecin
LRYAEKAAEGDARPNPSYDVFAATGTTYVTRGAYAVRRTRNGRATHLRRRRACAKVGRDGRRRGGGVSDHVYGLSEIVGSSPVSVDEAVRNAIGKAAQTVRNIEWFQTQEIRGQVVEGAVAYFQVTVKFGFRIE